MGADPFYLAQRFWDMTAGFTKRAAARRAVGAITDRAQDPVRTAVEYLGPRLQPFSKPKQWPTWEDARSRAHERDFEDRVLAAMDRRQVNSEVSRRLGDGLPIRGNPYGHRGPLAIGPPPISHMSRAIQKRDAAATFSKFAGNIVEEAGEPCLLECIVVMEPNVPGR